MAKTRIVTTLGSDLKTVNVWRVPREIDVYKAHQRQDREDFRKLYLVEQKPLAERT